MKVSIITVCFNSAQYIESTIESVLTQTYPDIEYILVDGGSKDDTINIIRKYEPMFNGRMRWISESDKGIYDAMNKGIRMASGNIVGIINSDDFYHRKDTIELITGQFKNPDIDAVYGDVRFVDPDDLEKTFRYYSSRIFSPPLFRFGFMPAHPTFFTRRDYFEQHGYYRTDLRIAADYELLIRFLYIARLRTRYLQIDLLKMRTGGESTRSIKSNYILNKEIVRACKENGIYTNMSILTLKYFIKIFELIFTK